MEDTAAKPSLRFDGLDEVLGFHLRQAQGAIHRRLIAELAAFDLSQKQGAVLWLIGANPGVSQIDLSAALAMDRATTLGIIDRLEARELVQRQKSKTDRRRQELYLQPEGQKMLVAMKAKVLAHEAAFAGRYTDTELATFIDFLRRAYEG